IISAAAHCTDINAVVEPVLQKKGGSIYYINFSQDAHQLGGSSFAQINKAVGNKVATVRDADFVKRAFNALQNLINDQKIAAGHDIGSGGLITTLLELCFADRGLGADIDLNKVCGEYGSLTEVLFAENPGVVIQSTDDASLEAALKAADVEFFFIGKPSAQAVLSIADQNIKLDVNALRDT